jgi:hypothetical protein
MREVFRGAVRKLFDNLIGMYASRRAYKMGQDSAVITRASTDLNNYLVRLRKGRADAFGVQGRLAIVDFPLYVEANEDVLVQDGGIICFSGYVAIPTRMLQGPLPTNCSRRIAPNASMILGSEILASAETKRA